MTRGNGPGGDGFSVEGGLYGGLHSDLQEIRRSQVATEARVASVEASVEDIHIEVARLAKLLKGNGEGGLFGEVQLNTERIDVLQGQWKWIMGMLAALLLAAGKSVFFG